MSTEAPPEVTTGTAPQWSKFETYEHLVGGGKTFRVYQVYVRKTYNNLYQRLELLTVNGWQLIKENYCGDTYYGLLYQRDRWYQQLKRYAEHLVAIGATISPEEPPTKD